MTISAIHAKFEPTVNSIPTTPEPAATLQQQNQTGTNQVELREAFDDFVGQTFFGHLLKAMRKTVDKPAYFHGGRAEDVFQSQLDQLLVEKVSQASAPQLTDPMFELFTLTRS